MANTLKLFILLLATLTSCKSQQSEKNEVKQFEWTRGAEPHNEYKYNVALSKMDKVLVIGGDNEGAFEIYDTKIDK